MGQLDDYAAFVAVIDKGSLTAAAYSLGRSLQAVSRALAKLEEELGVELVRRTTRRLQPTAAGAAFHRRIKATLLEIEAAHADARRDGDMASGTLRIGAPVLFASAYLAPVAMHFMQRWPDVRIEFLLNDRYVDLIDERMDLAIRMGELPDSSLRARPLAQLRRVMFASPAYLDAHGRPATPAELAHHLCVVRTFGPERDRWPVTVDGREQRIKVDGIFRANDAGTCNEAVAGGAGIGSAPYWQVRRMVDEARVELLLTEFEASPIPLHAVWNDTVALPARTRLFIDFLTVRFAGERW